MWTCQHCGETVDEDDFDACWRCTTPRRQLVAEPSAEPVVDERDDDDEKIAVFLAFGRGVQTVFAHPIILVAAVPLLVWPCVATMLGIVPADFFVHPTSLGWRQSLAFVPGELVFGPMSSGLATLLVYGAVRGTISLADAASVVVRRFPGLLVATTMQAWWFGVFFLPVPRLVAVPLAYVAFYVSIRLTFWSTVILIDGVGLIAALRRTWELTRGNWWRLLVLQGLRAGVALGARRALPVPGGPTVVRVLFAPVGDAIVTCAYLQRIGVLPGRGPSPIAVARRSAVALPGS